MQKHCPHNPPLWRLGTRPAGALKNKKSKGFLTIVSTTGAFPVLPGFFIDYGNLADIYAYPIYKGSAVWLH